MNRLPEDELVGQRQDRLLTTLERLLELPATEVNVTLNQAAQLIAEVLAADKVDIFFYNEGSETLISLGVSQTAMAKRQRRIGLDRQPIANGGRAVETFLTGKPFITGRADLDAEELPGVKEALGIVSEIAAVFQVQEQHRGVLAAASARPDFFSQEDLSFLKAAAQWVGIVIDRAEMVERKRQEAVAQGRRLAAEELLTIMAHDLHNYLTALKGRVGLLERRAQREGREQDLRDIRATAHTLNMLERVISYLLDIARLNQGIFTIAPQPMNLVELVREVVAAIGPGESTIQVQAPVEVVITADQDRLRQVLENLLANAVKYAPDNTPITVEIRVAQDEDGPSVVVIVTNQGPGLSQEELSSLLQPFVAGTQSTGLGLGLYLAHRIAQAHNGSLTLTSPNSQGMQVTLTLPAEAEELFVQYEKDI